LPLFFIKGTYQYNILQQSPLYMVNFFVSFMPLGFIVTWVYVKNNRDLFFETRHVGDLLGEGKSRN
jgi:hypothetical protein